MMPKQVALVGFDDANALDLVTSAEAFHAARLDNGFGGCIACYQVCIVGLRLQQFQTESGLALLAHTNLETAPRLDTIIVSGGIGILRPGVTSVIANWLLERARDTAHIATIGSGIYGLAATGLADGRVVATSRRYAADVCRKYPRLTVDVGRPLVQDKPFYSSSGINFGLDVALAIIEADYGVGVANSARDELLGGSAKRQPSGFLSNQSGRPATSLRANARDAPRNRGVVALDRHWLS